MRVISKRRLREFWSKPGNEQARTALLAWWKIASHRDVAWENWSDVTRTFSTANKVDGCVVFNVGGNKYRVIAWIRYESQRVYIRKVMTHKEYDNQKNWYAECGCKKEPRPKGHHLTGIRKVRGRSIRQKGD